MHRETLLPQPVLVNGALYAIVALVYSIAFFIIDQTHPGTHVFADNSQYRDPFSSLAICSWPILLFGALILIAVRVGANVRRRRKRRHRKASTSRTTSARSRSHITSGGRRSSSAPPALPRPPSTVPPVLPSTVPPIATLPSVSSPNVDAHSIRLTPEPKNKRAQSDHVIDGIQGHTALVLTRASEGVRIPSVQTSNLAAARIASKRSTKSNSSRVPRGFVSVTRGQKIYAAIGFLWVALGLFATSAVAGLVFVGQRQRNLRLLLDLGEEGKEGLKEWAISISTGGIFSVLFLVLGISACIKFVNAVRRTPSSLELRTVSLDPDDELEAMEGAWSRTNSHPNDVVVMMNAGDSSMALTDYDDDLDLKGGKKDSGSDSDDSDALSKDEGVKFESETSASVPTRSDVFAPPPAQPEDWRQVYRNGTFLPYQPEQQTVERMMRQLRDMGFSNQYQNIVALQASSFDLEIASDKLAAAQV